MQLAEVGQIVALVRVRARHGVKTPHRRLRAAERAQHEVRVGAAEAEATQPSVDVRLCGQVALLQHEVDTEPREVDEAVGLGDVDRARDRALRRDEAALDERGDAGGALEVADVGLDGATVAALDGARVAQRAPDRLQLDRVAQPRARAVRLRVLDVGLQDVRVGPPQQPRLGRRVWRRQAVRLAVLVDRATRDLRLDPAKRERRRDAVERHHEHRADALAAHVAVGVVRAETAAVGGREHAGGDEGVRPDAPKLDVDAADDHHRRRAAADRRDGLVGGDERGGARRVDGNRRALQIEAVGDAVGGDGDGPCGAHVGRDAERTALDGVLCEAGVVDGRDPREDTDGAVGQLFGREAAIEEGLIRHVEQQPLPPPPHAAP
eukprot:169281-Prymnesium_polylepis.2